MCDVYAFILFSGLGSVECCWLFAFRGHDDFSTLFSTRVFTFQLCINLQNYLFPNKINRINWQKVNIEWYTYNKFGELRDGFHGFDVGAGITISVISSFVVLCPADVWTIERASGLIACTKAFSNLFYVSMPIEFICQSHSSFFYCKLILNLKFFILLFDYVQNMIWLHIWMQKWFFCWLSGKKTFSEDNPSDRCRKCSLNFLLLAK